jgi:hypothetical protein
VRLKLDGVGADHQHAIPPCPQAEQHLFVAIGQRADKDELCPGGEEAHRQIVEGAEDLVPRPRLGQLAQNALPLPFAVAGQNPIYPVAIQKQPHPMPITQERIGQRGRGAYFVVEQRFAIARQHMLPPRIHNQANIGDALLFVFGGEELFVVAGGGAPVDPTQGVAQLVFAHAPEVGSRPALAGGEWPRKAHRARRP